LLHAHESRLDEGRFSEDLSVQLLNHLKWFHQLGTAQSADEGWHLHVVFPWNLSDSQPVPSPLPEDPLASAGIRGLQPELNAEALSMKGVMSFGHILTCLNETRDATAGIPTREPYQAPLSCRLATLSLIALLGRALC
jgi:hypothetical protein